MCNKSFQTLLSLKQVSQFVLCLSLGFTFQVCAQQEDLAVKAKEFVYSNPNESIKIAEHLLKTSHSSQGKAIANLYLSKSYLVKGDYNKSISYTFNEYNQLSDVNLDTRIENLVIKASLLRRIHLKNQAQDCLKKASVLTSKLSQNNKNSLINLIKLEQVKLLLGSHNNEEALDTINKIEQNNKSFFSKNTNQKRALFLTKTRAFSSLLKYDSAFVYINKTMKLVDSDQENNLYEKSRIYTTLGYLQLQIKEFEKSEESLFIALRYAEILDNPFLLEQIKRDLAINYLASNQESQHKLFNNEFLVLHTKVELIEQESVNSVYNILAEQNEQRLLIEDRKYSNYFYILISVALFVILIGVFVLFKSEAKKKRLREIINYLEVSRAKFIKSKPSIRTSKKEISIPEETEQAILAKLKRFEKSEMFLNKDMSLAVLAGKFETNTKYLSAVINKHYNDNFNTFINKLRINYIIDKLNNDPVYMNYKISYLASECGFTTHSRFATVFKSVIGMPPVTFIDLLRQERQELNQKKP